MFFILNLTKVSFDVVCSAVCLIGTGSRAASFSAQRDARKGARLLSTTHDHTDDLTEWDFGGLLIPVLSLSGRSGGLFILSGRFVIVVYSLSQQSHIFCTRYLAQDSIVSCALCIFALF